MRLFHKLISLLSEKRSSLFSTGLTTSTQQTHGAAECSGAIPAMLFWWWWLNVFFCVVSAYPYFVTAESPMTESWQDPSQMLPNHFEKIHFPALRVLKGTWPKTAFSLGNNTLVLFVVSEKKHSASGLNAIYESESVRV